MRKRTGLARLDYGGGRAHPSRQAKNQPQNAVEDEGGKGMTILAKMASFDSAVGLASVDTTPGFDPGAAEELRKDLVGLYGIGEEDAKNDFALAQADGRLAHLDVEHSEAENSVPLVYSEEPPDSKASSEGLVVSDY